VVLSERLLLELRHCWKTYRPQRYLIEGKLAGQPIAATSIQRAFRAACQKAGILKHVTPRSLRHYPERRIIPRRMVARTSQRGGHWFGRASDAG
jgi:integrase